MANEDQDTLPIEAVEGRWIPSIGHPPGAIHFREPPPGRRHAWRWPHEREFRVHTDRVNPLADPVGHFLLDDPIIRSIRGDD